MTQTDRNGHPPPGTRYTFGARPTIGAGAALKAVIEDVSELVNARVNAIKVELSNSAKPIGLVAGLGIAAAAMFIMGALALVIAAGLGLAVFMPGWAAAIVMGVLFIIIGAILAFVAKRTVDKMRATPSPVAQIKTDVREDVQWVKTHLPGR